MVEGVQGHLAAFTPISDVYAWISRGNFIPQNGQTIDLGLSNPSTINECFARCSTNSDCELVVVNKNTGVCQGKKGATMVGAVRNADVVNYAKVMYADVLE